MARNACSVVERNRRIKNLKLIVFDFDGVFTDSKVTVDENGCESVVCSRKDTLLLPDLMKRGIGLVVISKERNKLVSKRCAKMKLECWQAVDRKLDALKRICTEMGIDSLSQVAYMGDDLNDLECMEQAGLVFTVANGHPRCKAIADYVTKRESGNHAVREVCDLILGVLGSSDKNR